MVAALQSAWVQPAAESGGLDHLGVRGPCIHIYGELLPGINNVTDRLRYYSFYTWLIWSLDQRGQRTNDDNLRQLIRRADCLFTLIGNRHAQRDDGDSSPHAAALVGNLTLGPALAEIEGGASLKLSTYATDETVPDRYFMNRFGGLGQYYLGSLRDILLLAGDGSSGIRFTKERGRPLAEAFDSSVDGTLFWKCVDEDRVTVDDLDGLSSFCPCGLEQGSREQQHVVATKLAADMNERLNDQNKALVVCHKQVSHRYEGLDVSCSYDVATWGDISGKNDWEAFDTVYVVGLQYRPKLNALGVFLTLQGKDESRWPVEPGVSVEKWQEDVLRMLYLGPVAADVIQAINRVRCRRVINEQGDCEPVGVHILLPNNSDGESILESIVQEMPGIRVLDWTFDAAQSKVPIGDLEKRFLAWADNMQVGTIKATHVRDELRASEHAWKKFIYRKLRKSTSPTNHILRSMNISFFKNGRFLYFEKK